MSDEIFIDGAQYILTADAGKGAGLTRDYITRLCREGRVPGKQIGRNWYVNNSALKQFLLEHQNALEKQRQELSRLRAEEYRANANGSVVSFKSETSTASPARDVIDSSSGSIGEDFRRLVPREARTNVRAQMMRALAAKSVAAPGLGDAALRYASHAARLQVPIPDLSAGSIIPTSLELAHKITAFITALALAFGTYSMVDAGPARLAMEKIQNATIALSNPDNFTSLGKNLETQFAAVALNPSEAFTGAVSNIARSFNDGIDDLVYSIASSKSSVQRNISLTSDKSHLADTGERGIVNVRIGKFIPKVTTSPGISATSATTSSGAGTSAKERAPLATTIINNPVVERVIETQRILTEGGISEELFKQKLQQLDNKLTSQIASLSASSNAQAAQTYQVIAQTNKIDRLNNATISNPSISGGSISGVSVNATTLSASDLSAGGALLASTTVTNNLTVGGSLALSSISGILSASNASLTNATSTNFFATNASTTNATSTYLYVSGNTTLTNATTTSLFSTTASSTNLFSQTATFGALNINGLASFISGFLSNASSTITSGLFTMSGGASTTNLTVSGTGYFATATTTNLFANTASLGSLTLATALPITSGGTGQTSFGQGWLSSDGTTLSASTSPTVNYITSTSTTATSTFAAGIQSTYLNITGASATSTFANGIQITGGCFRLADGTCAGASLSLSSANTWTALQLFSAGASTTRFSVFDKAYFGGTATTTIDSAGNLAVAGTLGVTGNTTLANSTTTNLFSTTASSTNLFSQTATFGALNINGLASFISGFLSNASSTITSGLFSMNGGASTTNITASGTGWFSTASTTNLYVSGSPSGILATNSSGLISASTTIGLNFGGTGATTASGARANLAAAASGANSDITSLAGLTTALSVLQGGTGQTSFGQGWLSSNGTTLSASTSPTINYLVATSTTATSTFAAGLQSTYLNITGTSASSTFANGIQLTGGCVSINGTCLGSGSGVSGGTAGMLAAFTNATTLTATSGPTFAYFTATSTTATSTLAAGLQSTYLNVTGTSATSTFANGISLSGGTLAITNGGTGLAQLSSGVLSASSTLSVAYGGTGATTLTGILKGNGTSAFTAATAGTDYAAPGTASSWTALQQFQSGASTTLFSAYGPAYFGATATSSFSNAGVLTLATDLAVSEGGTGASTLTGLLQGNGTSAITGISGTVGQFPYYNGTGTLLATSSVYLATSGNFGIGTTSPQAALHVAGAAAIFGSGELGSPSAVTIRGAAAGGSNVAGANMTFDASNGTGLSGSGALIFRTAPADTTTITFDAASSGGENLNCTNPNNCFPSWSHTTTSSTNRILIISTQSRNFGSAESVSSASYGGNALTQLSSVSVSSGGYTWKLEMWYLLNPPTGSNAISVTMDADTLVSAVASTYYNVNQSTPFGTPVTASWAALTTPATDMPTDISSATNDVVVDAFGASTGAITVKTGNNQNERATAGSDGSSIGHSDKAGAASVTMTWVKNNNTISAVSIVASMKPLTGTTVNTMAERLRITNTGTIGIGTSSPSTTLGLVGSQYLTGGLGVGALNTTAGTLNLGGTSGTTTIASGQGFTIGTSQFVLQQGSGKIGIGTTTPNWILTSSNSSGPQLSLGDSTNNSWTLRNAGATLYIATSTYAATSTTAALAFNNSTGAATFGSPATTTFTGGLQSTYLNITGTSATSTFANGISLSGGTLAITNGGTGLAQLASGVLSASSTLSVAYGGTGATTLTGLLQGNGTGAITAVTGTVGQFPYYNGTGTLLATSSVYLATSGNFGIGTTSPFRALSITGAVSTAQQAIAYDTGNSTDILTSSVGDMFVYPSGNDALFNNSNLWVCTGGSGNTNGCPSGTPSGFGNLIVETKFGVASSTPWAAISVGADGAIVTTEKSLTDGATIAIDWTQGNQQLVVLGGNRTITFSNYIPGQTLRFVVCQDGTGSRTLSWPAAVMWAGGTAPTLTTTASKCDVTTFLTTTATGTVRVFGSSVLNF